MIEEILYQFLKTKMDVEVYTEIPPKPKPEYIVIERTGGSERNKIRHATVAIQSIGKTLLRAVEINEEVIKSMTSDDGIIAINEIFGCYLNSDYNFTDPETKNYRYQAVFDITYH
ncbi:hypothetical protein LQZ18_18315 [Lachnospiraceae bacterium ZAX-1]